MKKIYIFILYSTVVCSIVCINAPAAWLSPLIWHYTQGLISFENTWGTIWQGATQLRIHRSEKETLLLPHAIKWDIHFNTFYKTFSIDINLQSTAFSKPIQIILNLGLNISFIQPTIAINVSSGVYQLSINQLNYLGAPFNTLNFSGDALIAWNQFTYAIHQPQLPQVNIYINHLRTGITGNNILGNYTLFITPTHKDNFLQYLLILTTQSNQSNWALVKSPLILNGKGNISFQTLPNTGQFELRAKAFAPMYRDSLNTLLNLIGKKEGEEYVLRYHNYGTSYINIPHN